MKIAFIQNKLKKTDGVSLEVDKWRHVLERMGHEVFYCAGNDLPGIYCIPELSLLHPDIYRILQNGTVAFSDYSNEAEFGREIESFATLLENKIATFVASHGIELLIPNNLLSIGYNIPAVPALARFLQKSGIPAIVHSHDFYFEDSGEVTPTCGLVSKLYDQYAPPRLPNVQHVVINQLAQSALKSRKGIDATIVPNVFDFDQKPWTTDTYNADFRSAIGVRKQDLLFLQATRIMDRKGIEMAIDVVAELSSLAAIGRLNGVKLASGQYFESGSRIILVCAGYVEKFGITSGYQANLKAKAKRMGVDILFVGDLVEHSRRNEGDTKVYSLWDSYVSADFVTYPSLWEGWGNQLIEAVFARKPVLLFEYPVYLSDLQEVGFEFVSLGAQIDGHDIANLAILPPRRAAEAAMKITELLHQPTEIQCITARNYALARSRFSYENLERIVSKLLANALSDHSLSSANN